MIHKSRIVSCKFNLYGNKYQLTFMDSYLLLTNSLKDLGKSFPIESQKNIFPFLLNNINYKGKIPDYKLFSNISIEEYNNYKKQFIG